ncbi:MAG: cation:proton antiporter [Lachnospiraceae bacterium]|jgi:Kef-type K+ transport system membrane component KefB|nr:cation:proton antiporter [Lachnospiraceae bacterium]MCI8873032.1 cation:proton antiporter [Lachnospiraceae bacterium]GFI30884.1 Na(+)/H(+)-K(+) antiporter GerN [Lachnospiraceae bacterium]
MNYDYLLYLAIILMSTKLLGLVTRKAHMPQVVGALIAGLILGPAFLGLLHSSRFLNQVSEIGVIVLMFMAGLETDTEELKRSGLASFIVALFGVLVPLAGGFGIAMACRVASPELSASELMQNIFIGIILTATSVSITVETLKEMGKVSTKAGTAILGAAIIDDILGIVALTVITSMADPSTNIVLVLLKIVGFFAFAIVFGVGFFYIIQKWVSLDPRPNRRHVIMTFAFCLVMSFCAEHFFGVADITGAYVAGLVLSHSTKREVIYREFDTVSYLLVAPVFFASIGLKVELSSMSGSLITFTLLLLVVAILTKILGCGLGAKLMGYTSKESFQIGIGMISRGEVALIVANKGEALGLIGDKLYAPIVVTVVITTVITPILLKAAFKDKKNAAAA